MLNEHLFLVLNLLVVILKARSRATSAESFATRFESPQLMEWVLRICMVQGLTAKSKIERGAFLWRYFYKHWLEMPIPDYSSAWDFYEVRDNPESDVPQLLLLPPDASHDHARWVPAEVFFLFSS